MIVEDDARSSPIKFFFPIILSQPGNAVGVIGGQAVFTVVFSSTNPAVVTFLWQCSIDSGTTWSDLVETAGYYEGVATQTLTVKAIDNYLATRAGVQFRCRALFANAVPSYSTGATLTVPIHTDFRLDNAPAGAELVGSADSAQFFPAPVVTGFAGPFTYLWTLVDGDPSIAPSDPTSGTPFFIGGPLVAGWTVARWKCTITNGGNSVFTDPVVVAMYGVNIGGATFVIKSDTNPTTSSNGAQLAFPDPGFSTLVPPWNIAFQENLRSLAPPVASIATPNANATTFSLSGSQKGGTAILFYVACIGRSINFPTQYAVNYGAVSWLK